MASSRHLMAVPCASHAHPMTTDKQQSPTNRAPNARPVDPRQPAALNAPARSGRFVRMQPWTHTRWHVLSVHLVHSSPSQTARPAPSAYPDDTPTRWASHSAHTAHPVHSSRRRTAPAALHAPPVCNGRALEPHHALRATKAPRPTRRAQPDARRVQRTHTPMGPAVSSVSPAHRRRSPTG